MNGYSAVLRNRNFLLLWVGQTTSQLGDAFYELALIWLALEITNRDPFSAGVIAFTRALPYLFFGLIAGAYSDRWNRKYTMIGSDLLRSVVVLIVPVLLLLNQLQFWHLAAVAFALMLLRTFFHPSLQASIPLLVPTEHLASANGLFHASQQTVIVVGPMVAGFLLAYMSPANVFFFDSLTFIVSALSLLFIRYPVRETSTQTALPNVFHDIGEMVRVVRRMPIVFWSILLFGAGLLALAGLLRIGMPLLATNVLQGDSETYGLLMGAMGLGTVAGALTIGRFRIQALGTAIFLGWICWGAFFGLLGLSTWLPLALLLAALAGVAESVIDLLMVVLFQKSIPQEQLGKVFSFWSTVANMGDSLSGLLIGFLLGTLSTPVVFILGGGATVAVGVFGLLKVGREADQPASQIQSTVPEKGGV